MASAIALPEDKVDELRDQLIDLEAAASYSLADAMREGASVTDQAFNAWTGQDGEMCAWSSALLALKARRLI